MNVYDSAKMADSLIPLGYEQTSKPEEASLIIINTCHIREKATDKIFSELGIYAPLKRDNKNLIIVVAGCVVQALGDTVLARNGLIDIALGPACYHLLPEKISQVEEARKNKDKDNLRMVEAYFPKVSKFSFLKEKASERPVCSYLAIQEGCDRFCSYCVVPYTRGKEYSRPMPDIINEAYDIVAAGAKEITLLGQNVNAWHGEGYEAGKNCSLTDLLLRLNEIEGLERIRYVTSYPSLMTDDLIKVFKDAAKVMPYLHLPVQSGSDKVLKAMNRKYTRAEYLDIIAKIKDARADIALSSDFIVGFAGEEEEDFAQTLDLVDKVKFASSFSFKYSQRAGTAGAAMKGQVPEKIKGERLIILQELLQKYQEEFNQTFMDKELPVLFECNGKNNGEYVGHSPYMQTVTVKAEANVIGQILPVKIIKAGLNVLSGEIVSPLKP